MVVAAVASAVVAVAAAAGHCSTRTGVNGFLLRTADESRDAGSRVDRAPDELYLIR